MVDSVVQKEQCQFCRTTICISLHDTIASQYHSEVDYPMRCIIDYSNHKT